MYRIHGLSDSLVEFGRLMAATKVKVMSADQAEAVSEFYREVNPQRTLMTPITSLIDLKQAAERQVKRACSTARAEFSAETAALTLCQHGNSSFNEAAPNSARKQRPSNPRKGK